MYRKIVQNCIDVLLQIKKKNRFRTRRRKRDRQRRRTDKRARTNSRRAADSAFRRRRSLIGPTCRPASAIKLAIKTNKWPPVRFAVFCRRCPPVPRVSSRPRSWWVFFFENCFLNRYRTKTVRLRPFAFWGETFESKNYR